MRWRIPDVPAQPRIDDVEDGDLPAIEHREREQGQDGNPQPCQPAWDAAYKYKLYASPLKAADYCWDGR